MKNLAQQIQEQLQNNNVYANVYPTQYKNIVCVNIDGDWKHDHAYAKYLIEQMFDDCEIKTKVVNQDGSDWYEADHYVIVSKNEVA